MPVKRCRLKGKKIRSLDDFYDQISKEMNLPAHFGRNLDALWDVLTGDVEGPIEIRWADSALSKILMGADFDRLEGLLREVQKEREDFRIFFQ